MDQPFYDNRHPEWLLDDDPMDEDQARELQAHLATCPDCPPLADAWREMRQEIATLPPAAPAPGFTARWQARLVEKKVAQQRRIRRLTIGLNLLALGTVLAAWLLPQLMQFSLAELAYKILYNTAEALTRLNQVQYAFGSLLQNVPVFVSLAVWVLGATGLAGLSLVWAYAIWKYFVPKGVNT